MRSMVKTTAAAGLALAATACAAGVNSAYVAPSTEVAAIRADSLLEADRAFAAQARAMGAAEAFSDFMAEDGKLLGAGEVPVIGTEAIYDAMSTLPEEADISWTPVEAFVAASGELGVTWGEYTLSMPGEDGAMVEETGRYVTVWRKDERGRWRGVLDIGT